MIDQPFDALSSRTGIPPDFIKMVACLLLAYFLSPILPRLPSANWRHAMNIGVSAFFLVGIFNLYNGAAQLLGTSLVVYGIVKFRVGGKYMPWVAFVFEMAHMLHTHLARQLYNIPLTTIEISAMHMVLCMNLTSFAWSCYDGQVQSVTHLDETQQAERVTTMPTLLEFFGYCSYFPGLMVGPSTRFADYKRWANNTLYAPYTAPPPGGLWYSIGDLVFGTVCLGLQGYAMDTFSFARLADPKDVLQATSLLNRLWFVQVAGVFLRFRYFGIWALSDAACVLSGLGYNGINPSTNKPLWTRGKNVYVVGVMSSNNWKELLDAWNSNTNVWLRECVYKRVAKPGKRPGFKSMMVTFLVSAFWHGISLGYYFTFVIGGLCQYVARLLRKNLRPVFFANTRTPDPTLLTLGDFSMAQILYSTVSKLSVQVTVNFAVISFITLDFWPTVEAWHNAGYYGFILLAIGILAFQLGLSKALKPYHQVEQLAPKKTS